MKKRKIRNRILLGIFLYAFMLIWIYPFFSIFINSFKTTKEMMTQFLALPTVWNVDHYAKAWETLDFGRAFVNTLVVTILGVIGLVIFDSMAAYKLARTKNRWSRLLFLYFMIPMLVPFQTIMISTTQVAKALHLNGSLFGLTVMYWGISTPFCVFLYHGFMKSVPGEMDESALIDGASYFQTFWYIIFPMIKPITATAVIINGLYIWNDFILPLILVSGNKDNRTLQMAIYTNFGSQGVKWETALPSIVMAILPSILFFIVMQKHIIKGITAGAVKG